MSYPLLVMLYIYIYIAAPASVPERVVQEVVVQENIELVQEEAPITYNIQEGDSPQEVVEEVVDKVEISSEVNAAYNLDTVKDNAETEQTEPKVEADSEAQIAENSEPPISEPVEAVVMTPKDIDITSSVQVGEVSGQEGNSPINETTQAVVMENAPIELHCETETPAPVKLSSRKASPPITKVDLVNIITSAADKKKRESRENSVDFEGTLHCLCGREECLLTELHTYHRVATV